MKKINYDLLNDILFFSKKILKLIYIVIIAIIIFISLLVIKETKIHSLLLKILNTLFPFFIGFAIAWVLNPLVDKLEKKGLSRPLSSIIVFISFIAILVTILFLMIPILYKEIIEFSEKIPYLIELLDNKIKFVNIHNYVSQINNNLPSIFISFIKSLVSYIGIFGLSLIVSLYFLFSYYNITSFIKKIFKDKYQCIFVGINKEVRKCVNGTFLVATMVFVLDTIFFAIFRLPGSLLFGLFCGLTDLIPYIGPYIGGALAVLVGFSESKYLGIVSLIIVVAVQLLENLILQPIVMSKATKLNPLTIIIGLTIAGSLFGIWGMILATPIIAMLKVILNYYNKCS